jgi:pSer/pThr/pTyr-binding forkhead associated (FHA) protein
LNAQQPDVDANVIERFRLACGLFGSLSLSIKRLDGALTPLPSAECGEALFDSDQPFLLVGRDKNLDCVLDDAAVSQRHAYIQVLAGRVFAVDLDSRLGLHWDGGPAASGWIGPDRGVDIGPFRVRISSQFDAENKATHWPPGFRDPLASHPDCHLQLPEVVLEGGSRKHKRRSWLMRPALTLIGRAPACRIHLDDLAISRYQAAIVRTPTGPWVLDLLGRGGTLVNGEPARLAQLGDGDEVVIGEFRLRVSLPARVEALPAPEARRGRALRLVTPYTSGTLARPARTPVAMRVANELSSSHPEVPELAAARVLSRPLGPEAETLQVMLQMMGQWFGTLYQEQSTRVEDELRQLVKLNRDLADLYARLAQTPQSVEAPAEQRPAAAGPRVLMGQPAARPTANGSDAPQAPKPRNEEKKDVSTPEVHLQLVARIEELQREQRGRWQRMVQMVTGKG